MTFKPLPNINSAELRGHVSAETASCRLAKCWAMPNSVWADPLTKTVITYSGFVKYLHTNYTHTHTHTHTHIQTQFKHTHTVRQNFPNLCSFPSWLSLYQSQSYRREQIVSLQSSSLGFFFSTCRGRFCPFSTFSTRSCNRGGRPTSECWKKPLK